MLSAGTPACLPCECTTVACPAADRQHRHIATPSPFTKKQDEAAEETYYDAMKREMAERTAKTKAALDALDPATRVAMEVRRFGAFWGVC